MSTEWEHNGNGTSTELLASMNTGACYGLQKCAEVVYNPRKMIKGEGKDSSRRKSESAESRTK